LGQDAVVRVFHFQPRRPAFDAILRDSVLPDLRAMAGCLRVWAGRQGPGELGIRSIVSVWSSRAAMSAAVGDDPDDTRFHPGHLKEISDGRLEVFSLVLMESSSVALATGILRVTRGTLADDDLAGYARLVVNDLGSRREDGAGPAAIVVASGAEREVVMVSTWPDWAAIECATGASVEEPLRAKRDRLSGFQAAHYELLDDRA
jgi:quinol monooxygenase YgiN